MLDEVDANTYTLVEGQRNPKNCCGHFVLVEPHNEAQVWQHGQCREILWLLGWRIPVCHFRQCPSYLLEYRTSLRIREHREQYPMMTVNRHRAGHLRKPTALPREPWTVLNLMKIGVSLEGSVKTGAYVYLEARSSKTRKVPWAPVPRAWTTRSGMRSWSKRWIFSRPIWSSSKEAPVCWPSDTFNLRDNSENNYYVEHGT